MEKACKDVEEETRELEDEAERVLERIRATVGKLGEMQQQRGSDRSSGSHSRLPIVDEALRDLQRLEKTCNDRNIENGSSN